MNDETDMNVFGEQSFSFFSTVELCDIFTLQPAGLFLTQIRRIKFMTTDKNKQ